MDVLAVTIFLLVIAPAIIYAIAYVVNALFDSRDRRD